MSEDALPRGDWLAEQADHRVWWCEGGDARGHPVLIVHGGPGGASRADPSHWFDGLPVRWIMLDQRGCGRSRPSGETAHNTVDALLADMERLREALRIERWALVGGSWGALLALRYAERWPARVAGLFLRSPFLGSLPETRRYIEPWPAWLGPEGRRWLGAQAADAVFALYARSLAELNAVNAAGSAFDARVLQGERVAAAWSAFDDAQAAPGGVQASGARCEPQRLAPPSAAQVASWRVHRHHALRGWGQADGLARGGPSAARSWQGGPVSLVWGAADATCDPQAARALSVAWPRARAVEVPYAGHRMNDALLAPVLRDEARAWARSRSR